MNLLYDVFARISMLQITEDPSGTVTPSAVPKAGGDVAQQAPPSQGGEWYFWVMIIGMIVLMYFILIRPQRKQQKELQTKINSIKKGDQILTSGGMYMKVVKIKDTTISAMLGGSLKVELAKSAIINVLPSAPVDDDSDEEDEETDTDDVQKEEETTLKSKRNRN